MDISIIIVNWNSVAYLRRCLASIYRNTDYIDFEVIIIDNASYDGSSEMVTREFPDAIFIQGHDNIGFAGANNLGSARARGAKLLFLNPDTEVLEDAFVQMSAVFDDKPDAGTVGCKLLNTNGSIQTSCIQPFPTIMNQVMNSEIVMRIASRVGIWSLGPLSSGVKGVIPVEAISGACLMVRKDAFFAVGGFSSDYFMYTEDIDLCYKMQCAGHKNYYTTAASVIHHGGGSSLQRRENSYASIQMRESIFRFLKKTRGDLYALIYRGAMLSIGIVRSLILVAAFIPCALIDRYSRCTASFTKWTGIIRWAIGVERWTR